MRWMGFIGVVLAGLVLGGCRKPEPDSIPPRITVIQPFDGTAINVLDTLVVQLEVSDETGLQNVLVELVSEAGQVLHPAEAFPLCTTSANLTFGYALDNIHIPGGQHFLRISAFDAEQRKLSFVELQVFEVPREPLAVAYLAESGNTLVRTTPSLEDPNTVPLPFAADQLVADRWNRRWVAASAEALSFWDAETGELLQTAEPLILPPTSHALHWDPFTKRVYHAVDSDQIQVFTTTGQAVSGIAIGADMSVAGLTSTANRLALAGTLNTGQGILLFYQKSSGALFQSATLPASPTVLIAGDEHIAVLLEDGTFHVFNTDGDALFDGTLDGLSGVPQHAAQAHPEGQQWLVTGGSGAGVLLDIVNFTSTPVALAAGTQQLATDWTSTEGLRYYQTGDGLWTGLPGAMPVEVLAVPGSVPSVTMLMNK